MQTVILGSGAAGISAGYHLKQKNIDSVIFEKDADWGGLCGNFTIDGFRFDRFVHFTFATEEDIANHFANSVDLWEHPSISSNYYQGAWLKHPAQNNLSALPTETKVKIIADFINRPQKNIEQIKDYAEWLKVQYGDYFAENFPFAYTRKYWGVEAKDLETKWVGSRMHSPDLTEVLRGAFEEQQQIFYYTSVMKYPKTGGFRCILNTSREGLNIQFNKQVTHIDPKAKKIVFADHSETEYERLVSSLPLPEIINMLPNVPESVIEATKQLKHTSGYQISLGFNKPDIAKHLWFYIYDEDIPPARIYSPSLKSPDNVPSGCSSLQAEVFWASHQPTPSKEKVLAQTMGKLLEMGLFEQKDIVVQDIRMEKYANIIFDHEIYKNRQIVLDYLTSQGILSIGRFGKWDYLWSHQAFKSGREACQ